MKMKRFLLLLSMAWYNAVLVYSGTLDLDLELLNSFSVEVLGDSNYRRQLQQQMSSSCLDKLCYMMKSFTTCEV